jgi:F-type H+-transporting ATPase subunit delta
VTGNVETVYAEALFELAREQGNTESVGKELAVLSTLFADNPDMVKVLGVPTIDGEEKANFIDKIFKGKVSDVTYNFIRLLTDKKRVSYLSSISDGFRDRVNDMNNVVEITVTSAAPLSADMRAKLKAKLEAAYKKSVTLAETVEPGILGGVIVRYGNTVLDGSVKTKLDVIRRQLDNTVV